MSTKAPPKQDNDEEDEEKEEEDDEEEEEEEEEDFDDGDDDSDDDDDEPDFIPGQDDGDDSASNPMLVGRLSLDHERKLSYQGENFHFTSKSAVTHGVLDPHHGEQEFTVDMIGTCELSDATSNVKPAPRQVQVTWTLTEVNWSAHKLKGDNDEKISKAPPVYYQVYGRQVDEEGDLLEFRGGYHPAGKGEAVTLLCEARMLEPKPTGAGAKHVAETAAAARGGFDEDDSDVEDYDEGVDYDELIALHEDAGLPVDAIRKRAYGGENGVSPAKKGKPAESEEEDDDYGF